MSVPTNLIPTKITGLPEYGGTSQLGYFPYVLEGRTYKVQFAQIAATSVVPPTRSINTGVGLAGGGNLTQDRTIYIANEGVGYDQLDKSGVVAGTYGSAINVPTISVDDTGRVTSVVETPIVLSQYVPTSRIIAAGTGLTGGGDLSANRTLSINFSSATPQPLGVASAGTGTQAARDDHVHPAVDLSDTTETQGVLPLARGGSGNALSPVAGAVVYSGSGGLYLTDPGTLGQALLSGGPGGVPYWSTVSGIGTVTSVNASGGTTGLTFTGGPITTAGTLVLGGTLAVTNGGTGATTAADARFNLSAAKSGANSDITSMSGITGAIGTVDYIDFDLGATVTDAAGRIWFDGQSTLNIGMSASVTGHAMEDNYFYVKASSAITKGQLVMFTGAVGASGTPTAAPATGLTVDQGQLIMGIAAETIAHNGFGLIQSFGPLRGFNTSGTPYGETWADGDLLYYNSAYAGGLTNVQPTAPGIRTPVAAVLTASSGGSGSILIRINPGSVLGGTDSNVYINGLANNDLLQYDSGNSRWRNIAASSVSIGTATNLAGGAANRIAYQTGAGATGFIVAPTLANTFLEWSGTAFQWSANPLGTVTSVAMTVPTGLTVSGSPITTSGTLAVSLQSGYSIPTTASQTNWDTAYTDRYKWDGGSSGLVAATGRTSLGATTVGSNFFTLTNPSAVTFVRINADNTVSTLDAATFRTAIGAGTGSGSVTSVDVSGGTTGLTTSGGPITGSGTITLAGTLNAANGGTGQSSYAVGDLLYASSTTALSKLADVATGNALISGGVGVAPSWGKIGLTTHVSGTLPIANGGTNGTATPTAGAVAVGDGTAYAFTAAGTAGQVLLSNGSSSPSWGGIDGGTF